MVYSGFLCLVVLLSYGYGISAQGSTPFLEEDLKKFEFCLRQRNIDVTQAIKEFTECSTNAISPFMSSGVQLADDDVNQFCKKGELLHCIHNLKNRIIECIPDKFQKLLDVVINVFSSALKFGCDNSGQVIRDLMNVESKTCIVHSHEQYMQCVGEFQTDVRGSTADYWFSEDYCQKQAKFFHCTVNGWKECEDKTVAKAASGLYKAMFKDTPCDGYYNSSTRVFTALYLLSFCFALIAIM